MLVENDRERAVRERNGAYTVMSVRVPIEAMGVLVQTVYKYLPMPWKCL